MKFIWTDVTKLKCPRCGEPMRSATSIIETTCKNWYKCSDYRCHTYLNTAQLLPHQYKIAKDPSRRLGVFGGYGSGKTFIGYLMDQKHALITPKGETLIGADTLVQLENTIRKDFEGDFPIDFVRSYNRQKNKITLENNHIIYWRPLADEGDIRSYNLTRAHILEASETKYDSYIQLQSRVRNDAAVIPQRDSKGVPLMIWNEEEHKYEKKIKHQWLQTVIESNPDSGWIRTDVVLKSGKIYIYEDESEEQEYHNNPGEVLDFMSTHIIPTKANYHLPATFAKDLAAGKPAWWIKRYLKGSFQYSEGLVYPHWGDRIIPDFDIPHHWPRTVGYDYGLRDNSHFVFGAFDFQGEHFGHPALFFFAELVRNNANIRQLAEEYKRHLRIHVPNTSLYSMPVMDGRSFTKRTATDENKTLGKLFADYGCFFKAAQMNLDARVLKFNQMIEDAQVYFFEEGFAKANEEGKSYKFPDRTLGNYKKNDDKPEDKRNHGINAAEFVIMEVPYKLKPLNTDVYSPYQGNIGRSRSERYDPVSESYEESSYEGFGGAFDF